MSAVGDALRAAKEDLAQVNEALEDLERGRVARALVKMAA